ncbi:Glutaredoxin-C6 [Auxenochlorella protothecoides]|nr:Glutaredoxin-C6 [Auxenochlorella protothecoides]KFM23777.1 Glutaredoxin-C6 [Auxenochlorella protothecoides]RMZ53205.1 hypothetical protein APUTEX25_005194 [Auxenochlorella protothecoides]|eukprot:RMZ53205.1 hypothetical protein APUTEX25_005194 [Auxenochlorella protothecoides]
MSGDLVATLKEKNKKNPVVVYSKTYCPYCAEVKSLFQKLKVDAKVIELDSLADGNDVQQALFEVVGKKTVPQVFVGGQHIGGCDDTMAANDSGKLKEMLKEAGLSVA